MMGNSITCICSAGYSGNRCEIDADFCITNTCMNDGKCVDGLGAVTLCICAPGFTGPMCQTDLNYCTSATCRNGGTCEDGPGRNITCICWPNFTGPLCSININDEIIPCAPERDKNWMLEYEESLPGVVVTHSCSQIHNSASSIVGECNKFKMRPKQQFQSLLLSLLVMLQSWFCYDYFLPCH